jgi:O-antigen ligase
MKPTDSLTPYPTISKPATVIFSLWVLAYWLELGLRIPALATIRFEFLVAGIAIAIAIAKPHKRPRGEKGLNGQVLGSGAAFILVLLFSMPLSVNLEVSWPEFVNHVVKFSVLGLLISYYVASPFTLRVYLFTTLLAFLKVGQEAFLGKVTGSMVWENQGVPRLHGTSNTMFGDPNALSGKSVSTLPFMWYLYPTSPAMWVRLLLLAQLVFSINIIVFTASRTGYLTFIAAAFLIVLFSEGKKLRLILLLLLVGGAALAFVPEAYQDRFLSAFSGKEKEGRSAETRKALLADAVQTFTEHPLGVGPKGFRVMQAQAGRNVQDTHNLYLELLVETGIQGFLFFALFVRAILASAIRARKRFGEILKLLQGHLSTAGPAERALIATEIRNSQLFAATASAVVVFLLVRLLLGLFGHDLFEIYWYITAGLTMALNNLLQIASRRCAELTGAPSVLLPRSTVRRALAPQARPSRS